MEKYNLYWSISGSYNTSCSEINVECDNIDNANAIAYEYLINEIESYGIFENERMDCEIQYFEENNIKYPNPDDNPDEYCDFVNDYYHQSCFQDFIEECFHECASSWGESYAILSSEDDIEDEE